MAWTNGHTRTSTTESKRWARAVKGRDSYKCRKCGYQGSANGQDAQADHVTPVFEGGAEYALGNGQTLCIPCHKEKSVEESARARAANGRKLPPEEHPGSPTTTTDSPTTTTTVQPKYEYQPVWMRPGRFTTDPRTAAYGPTRKP